MFPELHSERLILRDFRKSDFDIHNEFLSDFDVSKMLTVVPHPYTKDDGEWWFDHCLTTPHNEEINWVIDNGEGLVGVIGIRNVSTTPHLGYWLAKSAWGKGYASEATNMVCDYVFNRLSALAMNTGLFTINPKSLNVLQKNGFEVTGETKEKNRARGDIEMDYTTVTLTKDRWQAMQAIAA
ncbi:Protein N-acetyltransferase, RimJ/RimL family [Pseudovibrio sp. Tun.PSC04-5.I4]|nr:Protein N-acetyltransferase, RimJ/RimL family [Pseudovibrio sp. Tun.PSC04-5.I4]